MNEQWMSAQVVVWGTYWERINAMRSMQVDLVRRLGYEVICDGFHTFIMSVPGK